MAFDHLWAPWRMDFIQGDNRDKKGCFLCAAGGGENDGETLVVARGEACFCMLNRYPYNNGHLMIAPYRHEGNFHALSEREAGEMMAMVGKAKRCLDELMSPQGYNIGLNLGAAGGAGVIDHIHMHVVPRWTGDTNFMTTVASTKVIPQALAELQRRLAEAWPGGKGS